MIYPKNFDKSLTLSDLSNHFGETIVLNGVQYVVNEQLIRAHAEVIARLLLVHTRKSQRVARQSIIVQNLVRSVRDRRIYWYFSRFEYLAALDAYCYLPGQHHTTELAYIRHHLEML